MSYIYKIINNINGKAYIGKTNETIESRFKIHIKDSKKETEKRRPLYRAFNKYGIENFSIEEVEECSSENVNEREKYWIEYYDTFHYGYNATKGGDGKAYLDYDLILKTWKKTNSIRETARLIKCSTDSVRKVLNMNKISHDEILSQSKKKICKKIAQIDIKTNKIINIYSSIAEAYNSLGKQHSGHITSVCNGTRKTAYGFKWEYL